MTLNQDALPLHDSEMVLIADYQVLASLVRARTSARKLDTRACRYFYQEWLRDNEVSTLSETERLLVYRLGLDPRHG